MCREGQIQEAYELAKSDVAPNPNDPWTQRELGWALYYKIKAAYDNRDYQEIVAVLDDFATLDMLSYPDDKLIFDNILYKIAMYVHYNLIPTDLDTPA